MYGRPGIGPPAGNRCHGEMRSGGEGGIRTHDELLGPYSLSRGAPSTWLGHLSSGRDATGGPETADPCRYAAPRRDGRVDDCDGLENR